MKTPKLIETIEELVELSRPGKPLHGCVDLEQSDCVCLTAKALDTGWRVVEMSYVQLSRELVRLTFFPTTPTTPA